MEEKILARWFAKVKNFGDLLAPFLIENRSGKRPVNLMHVWRGRNLLKYNVWDEASRESFIQRLSLRPKPEYVTVGSVLGWSDWRSDVQVIWGAGFMFPHGALKHRPRRIHAVRGHFSLGLIPQGWRHDIPALGDPGLLVADFLDLPSAKPRNRIGVIAHYKQTTHPVMKQIENHPDFKIISIQQDVDKFVEDIAECETVLSSAMHGLIACDSYGIPNRWINFDELLDGGTFKFQDYYSVFSDGQDFPDMIDAIDDLYQSARKSKMRDSRSIRKNLIAAHPF